MLYSVKYPSGIAFKVSGKLTEVKNDPSGLNGVYLELDSAAFIRGKYMRAGVCMVLDPRAVIADEQGTVVYRGPKEIPPPKKRRRK